jgi:flavin-dependent dehydrogenase
VTDILVLGGGLAGLSASLYLARAGHRVRLLEQKEYPRHKVCGEYLSLEVVPYLQSLGADLYTLQPKMQSRLLLTGPGGTPVRQQLPLGGLGLSRYALDHFLAERALEAGAHIHIRQKVLALNLDEDGGEVRTQTGDRFRARVLLNATGKRSIVDKVLQRPFADRTAPWMAVKQHMAWAGCPEDEVQLHNFPQGYCGVSQVESGVVNVCYLVRTEALRQAGSLEQLERLFLSANPVLEQLLGDGQRLWKRPLVISNVSFARKTQRESQVLMLGDAAGLISPLCGNGMAMAIGAGRLAGEQVHAFLDGRISRTDMQRNYTRSWRRHFSHRLWWGRQVQAFFGTPGLTDLALRAIRYFPPVLHQIIRRIHGTPDYVS